MTSPQEDAELSAERLFGEIDHIVEGEHAHHIYRLKDEIVRQIKARDEQREREIREAALRDAKDAVYALDLKDPYGRQAWYAIDKLIPHTYSAQNSSTLTNPQEQDKGEG